MALMMNCCKLLLIVWNLSFVMADFGQYPKGLIYNINLMNSWLYDGDATMYLHYEEALKTVKQWAKEGKFEALIQEYLLDNTHSHILILEPDENVIIKQEKDLADKLAQKKSFYE